MPETADLLDNIAALKALLIAATAREARKDERIERLEKLVAAFRKAAFGRKSERADPDQFDLALEDLETAIATIRAEEGADVAPSERASRSEAHTSELQTLMHISYAVLRLNNKNTY